ncbi:GntR family transcriptional regulator [Williamsia herbipolensis]|uniref:GntR family transcriptional regulator n=1 Tax=Williamsia herbipolensis TaxID=1603258 RepID=A0AAU4JXQ8_9NOCA|nr:GntR family transcriptional regulator [Williamsia herbipolensis]
MAMPHHLASADALPASLVDVAHARVRNSILGGTLSPGEKLVEEQLCGALGISRAPLREALRLLAQQGLVVQTPRKGTRVAEWSPTDIRQLFELRHVLERHAIEIAVPLDDVDGRLETVDAALEEMRHAPDDLSRDDAHRRFHAAVVGLAGNRQLDLALEPILLKLQLPMAVNLRSEARKHRRPADGIRRHEAIVAALRTNDRAAVLAALRDHGHLDHLDLGDPA